MVTGSSHGSARGTWARRLEEARFEFGALLSHPPCLEAYGAVMSGHGRWDVEQSGLPREVELRLPVTGILRAVHAEAAAGLRPSLRARLVAVGLADQGRAAIQRR